MISVSEIHSGDRVEQFERYETRPADKFRGQRGENEIDNWQRERREQIQEILKTIWWEEGK